MRREKKVNASFNLSHLICQLALRVIASYHHSSYCNTTTFHVLHCYLRMFLRVNKLLPIFNYNILIIFMLIKLISAFEKLAQLHLLVPDHQ
jgi:hypothetical protein